MVSIVPKTRPAYPDEFRREAVQMLRAGRSPRELAQSLGVSAQMLRNWRRQDQIDRREHDDGLTTDERDELPAARDNARLKQERDLLKTSRGLLREKETETWSGSTGSFQRRRPAREAGAAPTSAPRCPAASQSDFHQPTCAAYGHSRRGLRRRRRHRDRIPLV
jgi:transposase